MRVSRHRVAMGILVVLGMSFAGCRTELKQVELGELETPVYIRSVLWPVNGFRLADGRKDVSAFAETLKAAHPDFVVLTGVGTGTSADVDDLAAETGLIASKGTGVALLSRVKPEETWDEKDYLVVEQPDFSITVVDFRGEPDVGTLERIMKSSPRGKVEIFCAIPYPGKGTAAYGTYDAIYRTIADGIGVVRSWGAGGFTLAGEGKLGGEAFKDKAHLVIVKD